MPSVQVMQKLDTVKSVLERKGFDELLVAHYQNIPSGDVVLHDDHGRLARGDHDEIMQILEDADDTAAVWSALDRAGMTRGALAGKS